MLNVIRVTAVDFYCRVPDESDKITLDTSVAFAVVHEVTESVSHFLPEQFQTFFGGFGEYGWLIVFNAGQMI
jgi:hypothetical protein